MALDTFSTFYYGHTISSSNLKLNFNEGSGELTATIAIGSYTATEFATQVETAMNAVGTFTYTVTFNRADRTITIATSDGNFSLLVNTGSENAVAVWTLMGFTGSDLSGAMTYTGDTTTGSAYSPQFKLQDYVTDEDWQQAAAASVNKTASGRVEVVKFGDETFYQMNIKWVNNYTQPDELVIKNDASGVANLRTFMQYIVDKRPIEFMADIDTPATFEKLLLESTPSNKEGTGYKLKELYDQGLPGYYETGTLVFRVVT